MLLLVMVMVIVIVIVMAMVMRTMVIMASPRDSVISSGSLGSDTMAPPVPPKQAIGRTPSMD